MICKTENDCAQNVGEVCVHYLGPPEDPSQPMTLSCARTLPGRFLRVRQQIPGGEYMGLCEVLIYTQ